jgi:hypothetical protein
VLPVYLCAPRGKAFGGKAFALGSKEKFADQIKLEKVQRPPTTLGATSSTRASRRNFAASSGGVGLM